MALIILDPMEKKRRELRKYIAGELSVNGISQAKAAAELSISQQGFAWKLKNGSFTYYDLLTLFKLFRTDASTKERLMSL